MKILHITPHLGGGVGTVIIDWMKKIKGKDHCVMCLDTMNDKSRDALDELKMGFGWNQIHTLDTLKMFMAETDIVLVHFWDHPMLVKLFSEPIPDCRLVFWCHKNYPVPNKEVKYPDRFINTSPIQDKGIWYGEPMEYIWSTGNMDRFLAIEPKPHEGFNIGTVVTWKMNIPEALKILDGITKSIPGAYVTWIGDFTPMNIFDYHHIRFCGKVDDVAPYLAEMDVFAYPLRPDHYGTCEIALGEAMAAGVMPVVMDNPAEKIIVGPVGAKDEKEFIRMVEILHEVPALRTGQSGLIRARAKELYSIDNMITPWDNVFDEMMQEPKRSHGML